MDPTSTPEHATRQARLSPWRLALVVWLAFIAAGQGLSAAGRAPSSHGPNTQEPEPDPRYLLEMDSSAGTVVDEAKGPTGRSTGAVGSSPSSTETSATVHADPERALAARRSAFETAAAPVLAALRRAQASGTVRDVTPLWIANAIAVSGSESEIRRLTRDSAVRQVIPDVQMALDPVGTAAPSDVAASLPGGPATQPLWNIRQIGADRAWQLLGVDGEGVTVAILDSGVDYHHPALQSRYRGYTPGGLPTRAGDNWWCKKGGGDLLCGDGAAAYPVDGHGHGTHVAGTVLGIGGIGVAPGAKWIAARVCSSSTCPLTWALEAMQWITEMPAARRPNIVNMSFGTPDMQVWEVYRAGIEALEAAGVLVVAASGNSIGELMAPAVYPSALGVGATTPDGRLWTDLLHGAGSAFGKSLTGGVKPEVMAPGIAITSTVPGGGLALSSGTSMASPHVAGVAALVMAARPGLGLAEVRRVITTTSRALAGELPDPRTGWGRVDAYAAVSSVLDIGRLTGRVVRSPDRSPIAWAQLTLAYPNGDPVPLTQPITVTSEGRFEVDLAPGTYALIVDAFGFQQQVRPGIQIEDRATVDIGEIALERETPLGTFQGFLYDAVTGAPITGTLILEGVPFPPIAVDDRFGFSQQLPVRTYNVRVQRDGYRIIRDSVKVLAGPLPVEREYRLLPAPRILLVDGDAWAYSGAVDYFEASLDRLNYLYDLVPVTATGTEPGQPGGPPSAAQMAGYDLVMWSSSVSSPAVVRGGADLQQFLIGGGRLFLSGQDALCIDAGVDDAASPCYKKRSNHPYVPQQLFLRVPADDAPSRTVVGRADSFMAGITLTLNGPDSFDNQQFTDVLSVIDDTHASLAADYQGGGGAVVLVNRCVAQQAVAFGFGFEGIQGAESRDEVMRRVINALVAPRPDEAPVLRTDRTVASVLAGNTATFTLTLFATGRFSADLEVRLEGATWPTTLVDTRGTPNDGSLVMDACTQLALNLKVVVPPSAGRGESSRAELVLRSRRSRKEWRWPFTVRTPSPVLVVDGDYGLSTEAAYLRSLADLDVPYDSWEFGAQNLNPTLPTSTTLAGYPAIVWFTGRDFLRRATAGLTVDTQRALADYLLAGGRLFFASEDYLQIRGGTPFQADRFFHRDFLGVDRYLSDSGYASAGPIRGALGSIYADLGGCRLKMPGDEDYSDALTPGTLATTALESAFGAPVATQLATRGFKTVFLALDAGFVDADCNEQLLGRALDWFHPLYPSRIDVLDAAGQALDASRRTFRSGETVRLRLTMQREGRPLERITGRWQLPAATAVSGTVPAGWVWNGQERTLAWQGALTATATSEAIISVTLDRDLPPGAHFRAAVDLTADGLSIRRTTDWTANAPNLEGSSKSVPDEQRQRRFGQRARFVLTVANSGTRGLSAFTVTDTLPAGLELVPSTLNPTDARVDPLPGGLVWHGDALADGRVATLTYEALVTTRRGGVLANRAVLSYSSAGVPSAEPITLGASIFARPELHLPWLAWQRVSDP